jgi:hypothetical protein
LSARVDPGSNLLKFVVNVFTKRVVAPFNVCYVNPQINPGGAPGLRGDETFARAFNPAVGGIDPSAEPESLQRWTNMANTSTALKPLAAVDQYKGKNGPDIHPTPAGYEELANLIEEECAAAHV